MVVNACFEALPTGVPADPESIVTDTEKLDRFVSGREAKDLAHAAAFREQRHEIQREQIDRLSERLPLPQIRLPFVFTPDIGPVEIAALADAMTAGITAL